MNYLPLILVIIAFALPVFIWAIDGRKTEKQTKDFIDKMKKK